MHESDIALIEAQLIWKQTLQKKNRKKLTNWLVVALCVLVIVMLVIAWERPQI